jgi:dihydroxyacetone kinase
VLDAMDAAAGAAERAAADGLPAGAALEQAADAAWAAAKATAEMEPKHGRAAWISERARGTPDAGAVAWAVFVGGLAEGG